MCTLMLHSHKFMTPSLFVSKLTESTAPLGESPDSKPSSVFLQEPVGRVSPWDYSVSGSFLALWPAIWAHSAGLGRFPALLTILFWASEKGLLVSLCGGTASWESIPFPSFISKSYKMSLWALLGRWLL